MMIPSGTDPAPVARKNPFKKVEAYFRNLTIAKKMLLGYSALVALIILIGLFALLNLNRLNTLNRTILETDIPLIDLSEQMVDSILGQELQARRYLILKTPEMLGLFWKSNQEFEDLVEKTKLLAEERAYPIDTLISLHKEYTNLFLSEIKGSEDPQSKDRGNNDAAIKEKQDLILGHLKAIATDARRDQNQKAIMTSTIGASSFQITAVLGVVGFLLAIFGVVIITRNISNSIQRLKVATEMISEGKFDYTPEMKNQDELAELAQSFTTMGKRLKLLEEMNIDANPSTRLPGSVAVENVLRKRIASQKPLAFCLMDLDNFKAFNDCYGYSRGNSLIQATAKVILEAAAEVGTDDDFIGHIGGDDFALISNPDRFRTICQTIIQKFDQMVPAHYDQKDRERGHIAGKNRQGVEMNFPITSISIAVVTNQHRDLINNIEVGEVAAELKEYAKTIPGSVYVVDRRRERKT